MAITTLNSDLRTMLEDLMRHLPMLAGDRTLPYRHDDPDNKLFSDEKYWLHTHDTRRATFVKLDRAIRSMYPNAYHYFYKNRGVSVDAWDIGHKTASLFLSPCRLGGLFIGFDKTSELNAEKAKYDQLTSQKQNAETLREKAKTVLLTNGFTEADLLLMNFV